MKSIDKIIPVVAGVVLVLGCQSKPKPNPKTHGLLIMVTESNPEKCLDAVFRALSSSHGDMGDSPLFQFARDVCEVKEGDLSAKDQKLKAHMSDRCLSQYPKESGSLGRSQNARCHLLIELYWNDLINQGKGS